MLTLDVWGGLALYVGWPDIHVLNDTRVDLYGAEGVELHRRLLRGEDVAALEELCISDIVVLSSTPVVDKVRGSRWHRVATQQLPEGRKAVHLVRVGVTPCDSDQ